MNEQMFPYISKGCSRVVYAINDDLVIKIARYLNDTKNSPNLARWGIEQCQTELETYIKYGDKFPLCKIMVDMCTDERIIMERVTPLELADPDCIIFKDINKLIRAIENEWEQDEPEFMASLPPIMKEFAKNILQSGLTRKEIRDILTDVEYSNVGIKNNKLVILDYGMFG